MRGMRKVVIAALLVSMLIFMFTPTANSANSKTKTIVMFFAFNANLPAYQNFLEGFRSTLSKDSDEPYNLLIEYLDIGRSPNDTYVKQLVGQYNEKLKGYHIDLLLTFGPRTYTLLQKYGFEVLENTPTINIDLDPPIGNLASPLLYKNSMQISIDSAFKKTKARFIGLRDSVKMLTRLSDSLRTEIGHLGFVVNKYIGKGTIPADKKDLSGTWDFNVRWYKIAEDSIQSGINLMASPPDSNGVTKLVFIDFETVIVIFSKGDSIKCFYQVNSFSSDIPWTMDLTRTPKVDIRLNANPFDGELYVSYRKNKGFYYGFMHKKQGIL